MSVLAIIGVGPRGLSALEQFCLYLAEQKGTIDLKILLFETHKYPGAGHVWDIDQPQCNWTNISDRALLNMPSRPAIDLKIATIATFPSFTDWLPYDIKNRAVNLPDEYSERSKMGAYLFARYTSIIEPLIKNGIAQLICKKIEQVDWSNHEFTLTDDAQNNYLANEVLLTIGHQPTQLSEQLEKWKKYATPKKHVTLYENPYPILPIITADSITKETVVGIRGFGLTMVDLARALTSERGAVFKTINKRTFACDFMASEHTPKQIIPFSLDGYPLVPKPLNAAIDSNFTPSEEQFTRFEEQLTRFATASDNIDDFIAIMARFSAEIYACLPSKKQYNLQKNEVSSVYVAANGWIKDETTNHSLIHAAQTEPCKSIEAYIEMAVGDGPISLDYCIGQVWRHLQPKLYNCFSHPGVNKNVVKKVIDLDERVKRFSYGSSC